MNAMASRSRNSLAAVTLAVMTALPLSVAAVAVLPGVALADCGGHGPMISKVADARGTTFVGTFQGGEVLDRGVRVEWDVDEVYAGDLTPGDISFQSHVCDWMFLEPGARYLFSTGAPIPDKRAAYADTIVWRLDGDTASLASFQDQLDPPNMLTDPTDYPATARDATTLDDALSLVVPGHVPSSPSAVLLGAEFGTGFLASCADADASCALPEPGVGYVVVHTSEGDLLVTLTVDGAGAVSASDPEPLPSVAPSPAG
jgi:hypothetical protein